MAITYRAGANTANSSPEWGVTSISPFAPSDGSFVNGDLVLLSVMSKPYNMEINTPAGWTKIHGRVSGTHIPTGSGDGAVRTTVFARVWNGTWPTVTWAYTEHAFVYVAITGYQKAGGDGNWDYKVWSSGVKPSAPWPQSPNFSATSDFGNVGTGRLDPGPGDLIVATVGIDQDDNTPTGVTLNTGTGTTAGTQTTRTSAGSAVDVSGRIMVVDRFVTAAAAPYGSPIYSHTNSIGSTGAVVFVRVSTTNKSSSDVRTVSDLTISAGIQKTGAGDTSSSVDNAGTVRTGVLVPYAGVWEDGEVPTATKLNRQWRDSFNWLLGESPRPHFDMYSTDTSYNLNADPTLIKMNVEVEKVGFTHATNDTKVYATEDGWYRGFVTMSFSAVGGSQNHLVYLRKNGTSKNSLMDSLSNTAGLQNILGLHTASIYLLAGDYIELAVISFLTGETISVSHYGTEMYPRIELWWDSR